MREGRPDQVLRSTVTVLGWSPGSEAALAATIERLGGKEVDLASIELPFAVLRHVPAEDAELAGRDLAGAGAEVRLDQAWVGREEARDQAARPTCPSCGSTRTQPFAHAGPAARVNMACTDCGHLFRDRRG